MIKLLSIIALLILAIAWFNYINLSTAKALERAKEVSVRKVTGARKSDLFRQFLTEVLVVNGISIVLGVALVITLHPLFNVLVGKAIPIDFGWDLQLLLPTAGLLLFWCSIIWFVSCFHHVLPFSPVKVFKKEWQKMRGLNLRRVLVVFQFTAAVILIAGTLVVLRQIQYMQNQDLGVDIEQVLVLNGPGSTDSTFLDRLETFHENTVKENGITGMTNSTNIPGREISWVNNSVRWAKTPVQDVNSIPFLGVGSDFFQTYQLLLLAGRAFSRDRETDRSAVVLTEAAVTALGFDSPEAAIGEQVMNDDFAMEVIGVSQDFNQQSLNTDYLPVIFRFTRTANSFFALKLDTKDLSESIATVQQHWDAHFPGNPFDYFFLDDFF